MLSTDDMEYAAARKTPLQISASRELAEAVSKIENIIRGGLEKTTLGASIARVMTVHRDSRGNIAVSARITFHVTQY